MGDIIEGLFKTIRGLWDNERTIFGAFGTKKKATTEREGLQGCGKTRDLSSPKREKIKNWLNKENIAVETSKGVGSWDFRNAALRLKRRHCGRVSSENGNALVPVERVYRVNTYS